MPRYMLLLQKTDVDFSQFSPEQIQGVTQDYMNWRNKVASDGREIGGDKLADEGGKQLVMEDGKLRITDGPYAEVKEILGGYFSISADSYDDAVELSKDCPHLKYGGQINIRQIQEM
jgi:hypothetical protein